METDMFPLRRPAQPATVQSANDGNNTVSWLGNRSKMKRTLFFVALTLALAARPASAQSKYDPGASDTEIKIGNVAPYSGPVSLYGPSGR
jgi:hypothetical protein